MSAGRFPTDLNDEQWELVEPLLLDGAEHRRGPKVKNTRQRFDALRYITHTGCQWRFLPGEFGTWAEVWGSFQRWSRAGVFAPVLAGLQGEARLALGRSERLPSLLIIDSHLARGGVNGGGSFHNQGGPWGATKGAKRFLAVDVTGLPLAGYACAAGTSEVAGVEGLLWHLADLGVADRLSKVRVDKGVHKSSCDRLSREYGIQVERYGWATHPKPFKPIAHAWQVEVAHGQLGRSRRLSKSFEQTEASATAWLQLAAIHLVLDTWSGKTARTRTPGEQDAYDARKAAARVVPQSGDEGLFTPEIPDESASDGRASA